MTQTTHAVIGDGQCSPRTLVQGLKEVLDPGDSVAIQWHPGLDDEDVRNDLYDYVLDQEIEFLMLYEDGSTPPSPFRKAEKGVTQKSRNPIKSAVQSISGKGKLLILWDDENPEDSDALLGQATGSLEPGTLVLNLTDGLVPIAYEEVEVAKEAPEEKEEANVTDDSSDFSREELAVMSAAAVKRYGALKGATATTKSGIIAELFAEDDEPEEAPSEDAAYIEQPLKSARTKVEASFAKNSNEEDAWARLERSLTNISPSEDAIARIEELREAAKLFGVAVLAFAPFGRERSLAITKLEEAAMWAVKAIVLEQDDV